MAYSLEAETETLVAEDNVYHEALPRLEDMECDGKEELMRELDKGISDMEAGRLIPHEDVIRMLREELEAYCDALHIGEKQTVVLNVR